MGRAVRSVSSGRNAGRAAGGTHSSFAGVNAPTALRSAASLLRATGFGSVADVQGGYGAIATAAGTTRI